MSAAVFGLPILVALLAARKAATIKDFLRVSFGWGALPLLGLISWLALQCIHPGTPWTVAKIVTQRGNIHVLFTVRFYMLIVGGLVPYGAGIPGVLGCLVCFDRKATTAIAPPVKWALLISNLAYFYLVFNRIPEAQYLVPSLAWLVVAAMFGINHLALAIRSLAWRRAGFAMLVGVQAVVALVFISDLMVNRFTNYSAVEQAAKLISPGARVIVGYRFTWRFTGRLAGAQCHCPINSVGQLAGSVARIAKIGFHLPDATRCQKPFRGFLET